MMAKEFDVPKLDYKIAKPEKKNRESKTVVSKKLDEFVTGLEKNAGTTADSASEAKVEITAEKREEAKQRAKSAIETLIMRQRLSGLFGAAPDEEKEADDSEIENENETDSDATETITEEKEETVAEVENAEDVQADDDKSNEEEEVKEDEPVVSELVEESDNVSEEESENNSEIKPEKEPEKEVEEPEEPEQIVEKVPERKPVKEEIKGDVEPKEERSEPYYDFEDIDYDEYGSRYEYYEARNRKRNKNHSSKPKANRSNDRLDRINKTKVKNVKRRRRNTNPVVKVFAGLIAVVAVAYLASVVYFSSHMTWAYMGEDALFNMTKNDIKALLQEEVSDYFIDIEAREMEPIYISAHDIKMVCTFDGSENALFEKQNNWLWFKYYFDPIQVDIPAKISFDEVILEEYMDDVLFSQPMRKPANAEFVEDTENMAFVIQSEDNGTELLKERTLEVVKAALVELEDNVSLDANDCYTEAKIKTEDLEKNTLNKRLVDMCSMNIEMDWHGIPITVDKSVVYPMLKHDEERAWVEYEDVFDYVRGLSRKYDLFGQPRTFTTTEGHEIEVVQGAYGWRVDRDATAQGLYELIEAGEDATYEPVYRYEAYARGENDIGESYVEINLTDQHLYLYIDGEIKLESDFVSGNVSHGNGTHVGIYGITYKERDATLNGQGYSSPVAFWMPFNGNEGMHDASWRSTFGGTIYKTNGSHGCVNLPKENAEKIYALVEKGFPVIVFTDPESPNYNAKDDKPPVVNDPDEDAVNPAQGAPEVETPGEVAQPEENAEEAPAEAEPQQESPVVIDLTPAEE